MAKEPPFPARKISQFFRSCGNETSIVMLALLSRTDQMTSEELARALRTHKMKVAPLLSQLERNNLVTSSRYGRKVNYSLVADKHDTVVLVLEATAKAFGGSL